MKLWITGKDGLLGSILQTKADLATGKELDITNNENLQQFVESNPGITHIINCAAYSLVDQAEKEPQKAKAANVIGPKNLGQLARRIGAKLIHLSSDYIFDGEMGVPLKEGDPARPLNYYAKTKWEGESAVLQELNHALIVRTSWVFGKGGKNFVAKLLHMLQTQEEICLTDDQWGKPTYVKDLADALLSMKNQSGIFHYANQGVTSKYLFGSMMREEAIRCGFPIVCKRIVGVSSTTFASVCKRPTYSALDTTKIEQFLPIRSWESALRDYLCSLF